MKKILSLIIGITLLGAGCANNSPVTEVEYQKQQETISKLNKEIEDLKDAKHEENNVVTQPSNSKSAEFEKKMQCSQYQKQIEEKFNNQTSVTVFYSPSENTCVYESIGIKDGVITSRILSDILGTKAYALDQNDQLIYDEKKFGLNRTYDAIKRILEGSK
jgi:hypothetical protein